MVKIIEAGKHQHLCDYCSDVIADDCNEEHPIEVPEFCSEECQAAESDGTEVKDELDEVVAEEEEETEE